MNRPKKKIKPAELADLTEAESETLDSIKDALWAKVDELMNGEGYKSEEDFNFKMSTWVQFEASIRDRSSRPLVLLGAQLIQRRFYTVMAMALRLESDEDIEAKVVPFELNDEPVTHDQYNRDNSHSAH